MVMDQCQHAMVNSFTRKNFESDTNQRLLEKHERIESIVANLKSSPEFDTSEELQLQCQEVQDMVRLFLTIFISILDDFTNVSIFSKLRYFYYVSKVYDFLRIIIAILNDISLLQISPTERDHLKSTHARLDQLGRATGQIDETLFVIKTYLYYVQ